ncbi:UDP-3-O-(3-hydroxymyristoyl)glucosamine N-acyltransferase [Stratiformator vulcanicus]|uniref:UDP-3-O-acylglucosamine N-acyltransferase n=1 Tax=Stratiformator vulcanicus TaxID=2527980 RepID=A0A517R391_9PLAN|nr:UDP-3-O-(3-hydroxymyristoyl)glucosamine N-acyltransferase [Stratiformator vulcanicus]QDT38334.1 UDP-3-O-acylglucosamine N-acyltransferase [Stratiformator vulcanicus]
MQGTEQPIEDLIRNIEVDPLGDVGRSLSDAAPFESAGPESLSFLTNHRLIDADSPSKAGAIVTTREIANKLETAEYAGVILIADQPREKFFEILSRLCPPRPRAEIGISKAAWIHPSVEIGEGTNIYPGASVAEHVVIGPGCDIHPGVRIGPNCRIGANTCVHPNAVLYGDVSLGERVIVHANAVLGADGFGYEFKNGGHQRLPHGGSLRVEEDVEIGACTAIDRAMIGETIIGAGTKIDNLVQVAHNCRIGRHNLLAGQTGIAGTVTTGDYVVCAGGAGISDHTTVGDRAIIASRSAVHKNVPAGETWGGYPAQPVDDAKRQVMAQKRVPEMRDQIKELQAQVAQLQAALRQDDGSAAA